MPTTRPTPSYAYHRPALDAIQFEVKWSCPTRIARFDFERPNWFFSFDTGIRRNNPIAAPGYFLWNPYIWIRVLGLSAGIGICVANYPYEIHTIPAKE